MKSDARMLINKRKWNRQSFGRSLDTGRSMKAGSRTTIDARKILNLKRSTNVQSNKGFSRGSHKTNPPGIPFVKKPFSKVPDKHVKLSSDGNIWVTAPSKPGSMVTKSSQRAPRFEIPSTMKQMKDPLQWTPADMDMDNIEHIGIDDLIDMESLPPAIISQPQNRLPLNPQRTLADEVLGMQNTMVADQVASASTYQNALVFVTNLRSTVSKEDMMELFGDVGLVKSAEMPQLGTAIIEFYDAADASRACDTYHNRLLDGQPMKCYLQQNTSPQRPSISQRLGERIQNVHPHQPSTSMLPNPRSRYNPRDVRFTVKLS